MRFSSGQLVVINDELVAHDAVLKLHNIPGGVDLIPNEQVNETGYVVAGDVVMVIANGQTTATDVYVVGPNGSGWISQAFLKLPQ